ncbi:MAG: TetR/AcrR family transcriptional regulator [Pseudomonadota bacterium]|nr:TetR/AcrR family transcriptional regulator [Pseudomonadota bacterium]
MENPTPAAPSTRDPGGPGRQGHHRDSTQKAIRDAAISMFSEHGYHAVTLRKLADRIGIQAGSLYNHIENKQELLFEILYDIMNDLVVSFEEKVAPVEGPQERLRAFIRNHVVFHTARKEEVFIGNMELRNLSPENRGKLIDLRDKYQRYVVDILEEGCREGVFSVAEPRLAAFAILGMPNAVANWFNPAGPQSADDIADQYTRYINAMVAPE